MGDEEARPAFPLAIALFGPFDVRLEGRPLPRLHSQKTQWLLALLALQGGRALERAWIAGTLWPDSAESQAAFNLRQNLWYLRQSLGPEARRLEAPTAGTLRLNLVGAEADLLIFDEAISRGDAPSLERAVALHRGPLLQGCEEEWILQEREVREQAYLGALETLAAQAIAQGAHGAAVRTLRQLVVADPLRDSAQRALMEALAATGDFAAATQVYREFRLRLHRELNAAPDPETTATYQQIQAEVRRRSVRGARCAVRSEGIGPAPGQRTTPIPTAHGAPRTAHGSGATRLPRPLTRLVGREQEAEELRARLAAARLVTLTGPGGVGKTRLAIQVAETLAADFDHGVWFVDLGALADPALVPQTVATVLGVREAGQSPLLATLQEYLALRQLLLVLDNCEHLLAACAPLAKGLLEAAPHLRILATSRQALGLVGEIDWRVPSLSLPPVAPAPGARCQAPGPIECQTASRSATSQPGDWSLEPGAASAASLLQFDAVRLFVERAQAAVPSFGLTERNASATVALCRRLDGIPLAIELAAARVKVLPVEQITARLDDRFHLLTGGSRTAPPRQQTLRATLDWSYELLAEPERALLRCLSVFAGGFTLEAAEAVYGESSARCSMLGARRDEASRLATAGPSTGRSLLAPSTDVLDLLTQLIDKSLVWTEERGGEARYRLLETTREYAREKLAAAGEAAYVRRRHRDWYLQFAEHAEPELQGPHQGLWLERLEAEHDNLRAALEWALGSAPERALRLAGALSRFWEHHGHLEEGRRQLARALERAGPWRCSAIGALALDGAGVLALHQGDYAAARALYSESLKICRQSDDRRGISRSLRHLGWLAYDQGDAPAARALLEESLTIERELGDRVGLATTLANLSHMAYHQGEFEAARSLYEESLAIARELGDRARSATALAGLAAIAWRQEEHTVARTLYEESLAIRRAMGDRCGVAHCLAALGDVATQQGDCTTARARLGEALAIGRELGDRPVVADTLCLLGNLAWQQKEYVEARRFREESLALWRAMGFRMAAVHSLGALGHLARHQGEFGQARAFYAESLRLRQVCQDTNTLIMALEDFAELAAAEQQWARMTRLLGAALAQRDAEGKPLSPRWRAACDRLLGDARGALGEEAYAAAWTEGQAMALEQAIGYALADIDGA